MKKLPRVAFLLALYTVSFIAIVRLGIFSAEPPPFRGVLMFWLVLVLSLAVFILLLASAAAYRDRMDRARWFGLFSVGLLVTGLWASRFADYRIDVVLTEGQVYESDEYRSVGLLSMGLFSTVPKFGLTMENIALEDADDGSAGGSRVRARFQLRSPGAPPRMITFSKGMPQYQRGMFLKIRNFGYSLRYAMKKSGRVLESNFISLRVIPSGSEDYFRLLGPHTFYVRYYPGRSEGGVERPLKLKIARNKDIIFRGYIALNQDVPFEDATISFEEKRKWVEVSISRPWGELAAWTGLVLCCISAVTLLAPRTGKHASS